MALVLRSVKGSKLNIPEMDGNLLYLVSTLSASLIQVTGSSFSAPNTSITGAYFKGNGSALTNVAAAGSNTHIQYNNSGVLGAEAAFAYNASTNTLTVDNIVAADLQIDKAIDTSNGYLLDGSNLTSVNWKNRTLRYTGGTTAVDWTTDNRLILSGSQMAMKGLANTVQANLLSIDLNTGRLYYMPTSSIVTSTSSLLITASAASNDITFTKGDGSTFNITIDTGSGGGGGTPSGPLYSIQFNSASIFSGSQYFIFNNDSSSLQQGYQVTASGLYSHAEGSSSIASNISSHAEGFLTTVGVYGYLVTSATYDSGNNNTIVVLDSIYGDVTTPNANFILIRTNNNIWTTLSNGGNSYAYDGTNTRITIPGIATTFISSNSVIYLSNSGGTSLQYQPLNANQLSNAIYSHAEGRSTYTLGIASHAEGFRTMAIGDYSHAEGNSTRATSIYAHSEGNSTRASGSYSHAEGYGTVSSGQHSHAEGSNTWAAGPSSHAEGNATVSWAQYSHAEGYGTVTSGSWSHAEGNSTTTLNSYSHAEGVLTIASGSYSHAEGDNTTTIGQASHAEGLGTIAQGNNSHAEGQLTLAQGNQSHAEGFFTTASGQYSHAEGYSTQAIGEASHAEGLGTVAEANYQTVVGQYNDYASNTSPFVVGYGTDDSNRANAFEVTTNSSIIVATQSAAPGWTGKEGEMVPVKNGGNYYIYVYIGGAWKSASLA